MGETVCRVKVVGGYLYDSFFVGQENRHSLTMNCWTLVPRIIDVMYLCSEEVSDSLHQVSIALWTRRQDTRL